MRFPFVRPEIAPAEQWVGLLAESYEARHFTNFGKLETRFTGIIEQRFCTPETAATLTCNATAGLTAALLAHGVEGKVVVPDFTFPATLSAVLSARCEAIICDVDPATCEMDPTALADVLARFDVAAIMPVRPYGFVRDMRPLTALALERGIPVIIDAAAAFGTDHVEAGEGVTEVYSLHATKSIGIGEGGVIISHRSLKDRVIKAINFGFDPDRRFEFGINGKMSEFQAAVGVAQMAELDRLVEGRRAMAEWYLEVLGDVPGLEVPAAPGPTPWSNFPILLPPAIGAGEFEGKCHARGYQVRRYYWPTLAAGFRGAAEQAGDLLVSRQLGERAICLPLYATSTAEERAEIRTILLTELAIPAGSPQ